MRKLFALLLVAGSLAFAACEQKTETTAESSDTVKVSEEVPAADPGIQPMSEDTTAAAPADSAVAQ